MSCEDRPFILYFYGTVIVFLIYIYISMFILELFFFMNAIIHNWNNFYVILLRTL